MISIDKFLYLVEKSGIANENLGLVDLLKETWNRITGYKYNYRTRLLPFWSLILPTCFYSIGVHFVSYALEKIIRKIILFIYQLLDEVILFKKKLKILKIDFNRF